MIYMSNNLIVRLILNSSIVNKGGEAFESTVSLNERKTV